MFSTLRNNTECRTRRPSAAPALKTSLPSAEKCHGYIYIPGSTAPGLYAVGTRAKTPYRVPNADAPFSETKRRHVTNEARHVWRRHTRDAIAATAKGALNEIGGRECT